MGTDVYVTTGFGVEIEYYDGVEEDAWEIKDNGCIIITAYKESYPENKGYAAVILKKTIKENKALSQGSDILRNEEKLDPDDIINLANFIQKYNLRQLGDFGQLTVINVG
jgi:hypothetical protein